jgi:hypothetical protein
MQVAPNALATHCRFYGSAKRKLTAFVPRPRKAWWRVSAVLGSGTADTAVAHVIFNLADHERRQPGLLAIRGRMAASIPLCPPRRCLAIGHERGLSRFSRRRGAKTAPVTRAPFTRAGTLRAPSLGPGRREEYPHYPEGVVSLAQLRYGNLFLLRRQW